jgi:hypothetical protein
MNPNSFSLLGYLSVLLWLAVPLLWLLRGRLRFPGWLALLLAVVSLVFATINSRSHVNRIEEERVGETVNELDAAAAKRKAVEEARGGEVADIRFAEDATGDFLDKAGMDEADRKYLDTIDESAEPAWKKQKKERGAAGAEEAGLDDTIGGEEVISGVASESLPAGDEQRPPIIMSGAHKATADRLDRINLNSARAAVLLGLLLVVVDYLSRANSYARAAFPLPLPAAWRNAFATLPAVVHRPQAPRRTLPEELAWLVRRGDVFVCFTKDAAALPDMLPVFGKSRRPVDLLRVDGDRISDDFVFESLWYGRCCFVVDSPQRAQTLFAEILKQLELRNTSRARTRYNVHLVWNLEHPPNEKDLVAFERLASPTGFSLFISTNSRS